MSEDDLDKGEGFVKSYIKAQYKSIKVSNIHGATMPLL